MPNTIDPIINLNRTFKEIAKDLAGRQGQELRAKVVNGKTVLYSKKVNKLDKLVGNLFFNRASKRGAAQQLIFKRFELGGVAEETILRPARFQKPTAAVYQQVFDEADNQVANRKALPYRFEQFLQLPEATLANFLPPIEAAATKQTLKSELQFVLKLRTMSSLSQADALQLAAGLAIRLANDHYNVKDESLKALTAAFGVGRQEARRLSLPAWSALIKARNLTPQQLADIFKKAGDELAADLHNNLYKGRFSA